MLSAILDRFSKANITPKPMAMMVGAIAWVGIYMFGLVVFFGDESEVTDFWWWVSAFFGLNYGPFGLWWVHLFERNGSGNKGIYSVQRYLGVSLIYCFIPLTCVAGLLGYLCYIVEIDSVWAELVTEAKGVGFKALGVFIIALVPLGITILSVMALGGLLWGLKTLFVYWLQGEAVMYLSKDYLYEGETCEADIIIKGGTVSEVTAEIKCSIFYMRNNVARVDELHAEEVLCHLVSKGSTSQIKIQFTVPDAIHEKSERIEYFSDLNVFIKLEGRFVSTSGLASKLFRTWRINVLRGAPEQENSLKNAS